MAFTGCGKNVRTYLYETVQNDSLYENGDITIRASRNVFFVLEVSPGKNITCMKDLEPAISDSAAFIWKKRAQQCYAFRDSVMYPYLIDTCYFTFTDSAQTSAMHDVSFLRYFHEKNDPDLTEQTTYRSFDFPEFEKIPAKYRRGMHSYSFKIPESSSPRFTITAHLRIRNPHGAPIIIEKEYIYDRKMYVVYVPYEWIRG